MKILLVKLKHLGDTLLLTPTLRFLRQQFPAARIDVLVRRGCETALAGNPDPTRCLAIAPPEKSRRSWTGGMREFIQAARVIGRQRYDYALDLSDADRAKFWVLLSRARVRGLNRAGRLPSWKWRAFNRFSDFDWPLHHQVLRDFRTVADVLGLQGEPGPLRFFPQIDAARLRSELGAVASASALAVIHPTSRWPSKEWRAESWAAVADGLNRRWGLDVLFSCGPDERERAYIDSILAACDRRHAATRGLTSFHDLGWLLARARLFLGIDTAAMHLAAAMQTPTVAVFGPSDARQWAPWQCPHVLVAGPCACRAQARGKRAFACDVTRRYACLEAIVTEQVLDAAARLLPTAS